MITLRINGTEVRVEPGTTVLEAARCAEQDIPTLCHVHGRMPFGECRLCVVEVGDGSARRLAPACSTGVVEGLQVWTESERVQRARKVIAELLLASSPHVPEVRALAASLGVARQRFRQEHEPWIAPIRPVHDPN